MQIIKNRQIVANDWQFIADDQTLPTSGNVTVSLARWQSDAEQIAARSGKTGLRLEPADSIASLAERLTGIELIELNFPVFTDGRPFSHAQLLRDQLAYRGELRAVGHFMTDQVFYLSRVGVDAFAPQNDNQLATALSTLDDFSVSYQNSPYLSNS